MSDLLRILAVLALVAGNAFFVIGEYSVVTARRGGARRAPRARSAGAPLRLMDDPVRVISTVQVGITAIGILTGAIGEPLVAACSATALPTWLGFVIAFAVVTYLSVVFGELVPKALTLDRAERLAVVVARPVELISVVLRPVVWVLQGSARAAAAVRRREVVAGESDPQRRRAARARRRGGGAGVIPRAQEELLHNVFDFAGREVRDVMVPAPDVVWLDAGLPAGGGARPRRRDPHSRYPVGRGSARPARRRRPRPRPRRRRRAGAGTTIGAARPARADRARDQGPRRAPARAARAAAAARRRGRRVRRGRRHRDARGHPRGDRRRDRGRVRPARRAARAGRRAHRPGRRAR